jgi:hypothetical protein
MNIQALDNLIKAVDDLSDTMNYTEDLCENNILHTDGTHNCYGCVFYTNWNEGCMLNKVFALTHQIRTVYDEKIKNKLVK